MRMRTFVTLAIAAGSIFPALAARAGDDGKWALVVQGGAGVIERATMTPETEAAYREAMGEALERGKDVLDRGGSALDAVVEVIRGFEEDPLFNCGRGAVFTAAGHHELDASIMDGATLDAGAVAGVTGIAHPIVLARAVMEKSRHVMLQGDGAENFAREQGMEMMEPAWFFTERRWASLEKALHEQGLPIPSRPAGAPEPGTIDQGTLERDDREHRFGTVGVAALDRAGNLAAGTSTGGTNAKRWGRVGDSPIIGAGTYANNRSCAVSATGTGEYFIRLTVASRIAALVEFQGLDLQDACDRVVQDELGALGGDGGIIAMTADGQIAWSFNTPGMYRARLSEGDEPVVALYGDEE